MRIALVHDWLTGMRGGEKCLEPLCQRFPQARLFTLLHVKGSTSPAIERMPITTSFLQGIPGASRHYRHLLPLMPAAIERLPIPRDIDLVLSFSHAVAKGVRVPTGVPHVCYCFTPMRYAWDLRHEYFGNSKSPLSAVRNLLLDRLQRWDCTTSDRVTQFVAISRTVADRIAANYDRTSTIIYPPVDTEFYTPSDARGVEASREDYYLCVSALAPYKRLDLAIAACNRLKRKLIVIGEGPARKKLAAMAGPTASFLGWRSNAEIRDHLRRCRALIFPGLEDFGIVPLEAQACGTPVIALAQGGATETVLPPTSASAGSGLFFDEPTEDALIEALLSLERAPDQCSPEIARQQAQRFAPERFIGELTAFLQRVVRDACRIDWGIGEIRSPKHEIRNKSEIRNPKLKTPFAMF